MRHSRRLGALDASQNIGEALGPALAGFLWQSGGIFALFAIRILVAVAAEVAAIRTFGEFQAIRGAIGRRRQPPSAAFGTRGI